MWSLYSVNVIAPLNRCDRTFECMDRPTQWMWCKCATLVEVMWPFHAVQSWAFRCVAAVRCVPCNGLVRTEFIEWTNLLSLHAFHYFLAIYGSHPSFVGYILTLVFSFCYMFIMCLSLYVMFCPLLFAFCMALYECCLRIYFSPPIEIYGMEMHSPQIIHTNHRRWLE